MLAAQYVSISTQKLERLLSITLSERSDQIQTLLGSEYTRFPPCGPFTTGTIILFINWDVLLSFMASKQPSYKHATSLEHTIFIFSYFYFIMSETTISTYGVIVEKKVSFMTPVVMEIYLLSQK